MKNKEGYEIYTRSISDKDVKKINKNLKKRGLIDKDGNLDLSKFLNKEDIND